MITLFPNRWSATRAVGFISYFGASIVCGVSWLEARRHPRSYPESDRLALVLTLIESLLCLDMLFEWRFDLRSAFTNLFLEFQPYSARHPLQINLLCGLVLLLILGLGMALHRFKRRKGALLAVIGVTLSLTLYSTEIISLHETDRGLYHLVSGVMVIAFLWAFACALTLLGIRMEAQSAARRI